MAGLRSLMFWQVLKRILLALGVIFVAIQFVPYGWWHDNPPVVDDAPWPDTAAEAVARSSCYSCHSNETDWPLYSYVAPMSWLVRRPDRVWAIGYLGGNRRSVRDDSRPDRPMGRFPPSSRCRPGRVHAAAARTDRTPVA